jgi:hypothetical protein
MAIAAARKQPSPAELVAQIRKDLDVAELRLAQCLRSQAEYAERSITEPAAVKDYDQATHSVEVARNDVGRLKIALKSAEEKARQAEAERVAKERAGLIDRVEKLFGERDAVAAELEDLTVKADAAFRKLIAVGGRLAAAWPWSGTDLAVAQLTPTAIYHATAHQLYRCGARPFIGGVPGMKSEPGFPGGACPSNELRGLPDRIPSLSATMREASAYGRKVMRNGRAELPAAAPAEPAPQRSEGEDRLAKLLKRQSELADAVLNNPASEEEYFAVIKEISTLQAQT